MQNMHHDFAQQGRQIMKSGRHYRPLHYCVFLMTQIQFRQLKLTFAKRKKNEKGF